MTGEMRMYVYYYSAVSVCNTKEESIIVHTALGTIFLRFNEEKMCIYVIRP